MQILKCSVRLVKLFSNIPKSLVSSSTKGRNYSENGLSYFHKVGKEPLVYRTIGQQLTHLANKNGDREAIVAIEENRRLTFNQLQLEADHLAAGLQRLGLQRGDRIGIWAPQIIAWPVVLYAAARAGLILVTLNPAYEATELEFCLRSVGVKALVAADSFRGKSYHEKLLEIIPELTSTKSGRIQSSKLPDLTTILIDSEKNYDGTFRLGDILALPTTSEVLNIEDQQTKISPDSGCNIQFTSGTTGKPKAALLNHYGFVNNAIGVATLELESTIVCNQMPFFHITGALGVIVGVLSANATIVIPSIAYNSEKSLYAIQNEACNVVNGTPAMYVDMINKQKKMKLKIKPDIAVSAGATCPVQLLKDMKKEIGFKKVKIAYGMTETGITFNTRPEDEDDQTYERVGRIQDHIEVKVIDKSGNIVPFGVAGELCIRGYSNMVGYWGNNLIDDGSHRTDGWFRTGDNFVLHPNGYGQIVGRLKELIIRGGENIYPQEIENLLATVPQISEVQIIGVPDERLGEEVCAYIRLHQGYESLTVEEVRDFCNGKIAHFKIPRYVRIVKDFPRTQSGKVQKFKLVEMFLQK
ncbi:medium-chain acyl-CoA ligase ACSF2, mitochondrial-like [Lutzomyia longipalpis]|uniref:medium-chain acyl-CoA ligase ACSF2, mitochondrial-like n=1 Tax=Lutzomyia longipalpis TaxID=7200 RepID=UPI002483D879|nr:medium-chain acyl-CoA ligase ACSF2, mitochondrial-like [Lutzomyia longipalpis]